MGPLKMRTLKFYRLRTLLLFYCIFFSIVLQAQELQSPSAYLGYPLGTQFTRHHEVVDYFRYVAATVPEQIRLQEYGETNERRPLLLAYLSSPDNMSNLEGIRTEHLKNTDTGGNGSKAIVWLSYNVHGNESVSTEASMQTLYELLTEKKAYLENTVVIMDPCINPDGRDRYVNWYNQFRNMPHTVDANSKEHHEGWLTGRPNHYMFDLNRDWAWLTQVESQQRIKVFNKWLPHVHVDFHEQGVDNPYYFAPAAEPFHEVITDFQRDFQVTIGKNHAKYFDANGWFYFTREVFDLLYPSYGDTFPTYNGAIGMTYEQGGSGHAGLGIKTSNGDTLTLKDRIDHHHTTGLSTVEVASENAQKLNDEFRKFYQRTNFKYNSYVMRGHPDKIDALTELLDQHEITYGTTDATTVKGLLYGTGKNGSLKTSGKNLVVSTDQPKGTLVKVLFEPNAKLSDSLTYDITAWSLPFAYGLEAVAATNGIPVTPYAKNKVPDLKENNDAYAYLSSWNSMKDAAFLGDLLQQGIRVRFAQKPFAMDGKRYDRGTLIVTKADNMNRTDFETVLKSVAKQHEKGLTATTTGFVEDGKDFGSGSVKMVPELKVAMLSGDPVSTLRFGEIWHFFEQQLHYPLTILRSTDIFGVELSEYDVLILPDGWGYGRFLNDDKRSAIKEWVKNGGKVIAMGGAIKGITGEKGFSLKPVKKKKDSTVNPRSYEASEREQIKNAITGAIFKTRVDTTHPLAFGYGDTYFSLKLGADAYSYLDTGTVVYLQSDDTRPVSGFAGNEAQKKIGNTLVFGVERHGKGTVVYMVDNPLFRGFWENGKLFFANALFMVN